MTHVQVGNNLMYWRR